MDKPVDSPENRDDSKTEMDTAANNKGNNNKPEAKSNPSHKLIGKDVNMSIPELEPVCSNDESIGVASNDEGAKSNGVASNDESDESNKVARNNEGNEIVSNDESNKTHFERP